MGSVLTRHLRDLADLGGFEGMDSREVPPSFPQTHYSLPHVPTGTASETCPATPTDVSSRLIILDPRSPSAEITRTPLEVSSKHVSRNTESSTTVSRQRWSFLETDLDTMSTNETITKREGQDPNLPLGLSSSHLTKLKFWGVDPRSPSTNVTRTPIQVSGDRAPSWSPNFDETLSLGSLSSCDMLNSSCCSSEFTRDCSDPSVIVSEIEDANEAEAEKSLTPDFEVEDIKEEAEDTISQKPDPSSLLNGKSLLSVEGHTKPSSGLSVFQEEEPKCNQGEKSSQSTPDGLRKPSGNRTRTPLTPICNHNRTPNSILRAKQSQIIEKEILTKAKIYSMDGALQTPPKIRLNGSNKKENALGGGGLGRKAVASNNENTPLSASKKKVLAQWDQDNSVII